MNTIKIQNVRFKFLGANWRTPYANFVVPEDMRPTPGRAGAWSPKVKKLAICASGWHVMTNRIYLRGNFFGSLFLVEVRGRSVTGTSNVDKSTHEQIRFLMPFETTEFTAFCRKNSKELADLAPNSRGRHLLCSNYGHFKGGSWGAVDPDLVDRLLNQYISLQLKGLKDFEQPLKRAAKKATKPAAKKAIAKKAVKRATKRTTK